MRRVRRGFALGRERVREETRLKPYDMTKVVVTPPTPRRMWPYTFALPSPRQKPKAHPAPLEGCGY